jgi:hypothetical protein
MNDAEDILLMAISHKLAQILSRYPELRGKINQAKAERPEGVSNDNE